MSPDSQTDLEVRPHADADSSPASADPSPPQDEPESETTDEGGTEPLKIRLVTATSLFDGHDASINIMRRIAQAAGAEVIHLGHNRSVAEIVDAAVQEDAQGIAVTSYQGGHNEYFRYMRTLLQERGCGHVRIFGGGGGVILPEEIEALHADGIERLYSPDDGREMGLQGMIDDMLERASKAFELAAEAERSGEAEPGVIGVDNHRAVAVAVTMAERHPAAMREMLDELPAPEGRVGKAPVLGITGTGGAGKSSLIDEFIRRFLRDFEDKHIAILSVDPSRRKTGGALLGDRIRMNAINSPRAYMRSMATRQSNLALAGCIPEALGVLQASGFDLIILETSGIGQADTEIVDMSDVSLYVMTPEYGAATQLEKIDMLDFADVIAINKFDRMGAEDALRDVKKQYRRNHNAFEIPDDAVPVYGTMASRWDDPGANQLYKAVIRVLHDKAGATELVSTLALHEALPERASVIPPRRRRYLAEIADANRAYGKWAEEQAGLAREAYRLQGALDSLRARATRETATGETATGETADAAAAAALPAIEAAFADAHERLDSRCREALDRWPEVKAAYEGDVFKYQVRGREIEIQNKYRSLSHIDVPKVALPQFDDWGALLEWLLKENVPGSFPYAAGVFPFKREGEDPTRMFAGEGGPERTNRRFHYVSLGQPAKRLSTAFDSVTLYGEDPAERPDIYGKVGNAGVSICSLDDAKKLYSGFDLCSPKTSVSMTINGPAPMVLAFFLNAAIDQQCELYIDEHGLVDEVNAKIDAIYAKRGMERPHYAGELPEGNDGLGLMLLGVTGDQVLPRDVYQSCKEVALAAVRGTVQADILKEDQAQNTCIFSTEFALRMMGDIQEFFVEKGVRNFYSVSISGYHIAEAGANPISQLAFTLANGFTFVEYYLARGMHIDSFAPNLSFFFSNGLDAEYSVIGRVARRIWAKAMRLCYSANERSQKLKYHIQTSGRSLHAQEIAFNDIRTTLQALYAIDDNCQSLHTNAYDEAITTPTEESVRRAMAIQLIINREFGLAKNENPLQGAFITDYLTDVVEAAVLEEFDRISDRGGVLGAMETMYQRGKIQEESLYYEHQKSSGELPIVGVNTFLGSDGSPIMRPRDVMRSSEDEKQRQIENVAAVRARNEPAAGLALEELQRAALAGGNVFEGLVEAAKVCTLGQISGALYRVGGQYRRNM